MISRGLVLACVVLFAGCSGLVAPGPESPSPSPGWTGDPDNHFRTETLTVAVENEANASRNFTTAVSEALAYWEDNTQQYAGFSVEYRLDPDATNPDVRVRFVEDIATCGTENHTAGCAPILTDTEFDRPVTIRVAGGFTYESTVSILKHEIGHAIGLRHGDRPRSVMRAVSKLTTLPRPAATTRALPWSDPELSVYRNLSGAPPDDRDEIRRQIAVALDYYADGAEGTVPENVTFVYTDNRTAADVIVNVQDELACGPDSGSCGALVGRDPDGDGTLEVYTQLQINIADLETDAVAWHVGRWLGKGFGFETDSEYPEPLRSDASYGERRSRWWT